MQIWKYLGGLLQVILYSIPHYPQDIRDTLLTAWTGETIISPIDIHHYQSGLPAPASQAHTKGS